jgi:hypothetical protein
MAALIFTNRKRVWVNRSAGLARLLLFEMTNIGLWRAEELTVARSWTGDTARPKQLPSQYRWCSLPLSLHQIIWASCRTGPILLLLVHFYGYSMFTVQYAQIQNLQNHATRNNEPELKGGWKGERILPLHPLTRSLDQQQIESAQKNQFLPI